MKELKITCGKTIKLNEYLVKKHADTKANNKIEIRIPKFEYNDGEPVKYIGFKPVEIDGLFVIYNDKYHGSLHVAHYNDMLKNIGMFLDYEDFDESDIIESFQTLKEAVMYMIKQKKVSKKILDAIMDGDYPDFNTGTYDSEAFFADVLRGDLTDEEVISDEDESVYDQIIGIFPDIKNASNFKKDFK